MKKIIFVLMVLCVSAAMMVGCGSSESTNQTSGDTKDITVAFVPKITENAFFEAANVGAQSFAAKHGFKVEYLGTPSPSVESQIEIIKDCIEQKVDAICISSLDATALDEVLKEAMRAGIYVTTWDSDVSGDARSVMVSQGTPDQLGQMLVEMGANSLLDRGKDPSGEPIKYAWHYSQAFVTDQNSWCMAGEKYIKETYPNWENVAPDNYYSEQNAEKALAVGKTILTDNSDIDLIICNDSTALPGQAQAAEDMGLNAKAVSITGFASPNAMKEFCKAGIVERWGLWDCQIQGALGCYLAYYLAAGNQLNVGDSVNVPDIGIVEVMPNTVLSSNAYTANNSGVVLLPERAVFTIDNVDNYNF